VAGLLVYPDSPNDAPLNLQLGTALLKSKKKAQAKPYLLKVRQLGGEVPADVAAEAGL
jgi:hypothetical protein